MDDESPLPSDGRTPPGVRELKRLLPELYHVVLPRRTPPGVRELKLRVVDDEVDVKLSHPSRGA